jgi:nitric oxide dioxygenase
MQRYTFLSRSLYQNNIPISDQQPLALATACIAYATNINDLSPLLVPGGPVAAICNRHVALGIHPMQYPLVHDVLMSAIGEVLDGVVTPEIAAAWSEAVLFLAKAMIDTEESLYQMLEQREGGWSGFAEFEVSEINDLTENVRQVSFKPPAGSPLAGKNFDFTAGQYLSLQIDIDGNGLTAPRHYTTTSPIGADYLQCTIKKIKGGKVSTFVHEHLKVGDKVTLSAPLGVFTAPEEPTPAVLMSAGIGVTPMVNLKRSLGESVKFVVHVDKSPESHPYKDHFDGSDSLFMYTSESGRPTAEALVAKTLEKAGKDNEFYICGPEQWMDNVQKTLLAKGAKKVVCEVFGSQLATGCPFFASS